MHTHSRPPPAYARRPLSHPPTQVLAGVFQSTGWPSVVSIMANWFGKGKRGLVMGVWNAHTSIGNILGTVIAAACLQYGWGWSFVLPGLLMVGCGFVIFAFLVAQPSDVGLASPYEAVRNDELVSRATQAAGAGQLVCAAAADGDSAAAFKCSSSSSRG